MPLPGYIQGLAVSGFRLTIEKNVLADRNGNPHPKHRSGYCKMCTTYHHESDGLDYQIATII